jgi:DNA segregation ATPase FtsK/SpoIIIE, S-DNA-T family
VSRRRSSVRADGRTKSAPYARRREAGIFADDFGEPARWPARPPGLPELVTWLGWRYRHELAPFYFALVLAGIASTGHELVPRWWPAALLVGAAITAAVWHWKAERRAEEIYVVAVGSAATLWTTAAWFASPWHGWAFWTAVLGAVAAGIPRWWHYRRRGKIAVRRGVPRRARRELRRIVKHWPELSEYMELSGSHVQRAEADAVGFTFTLALRTGLTAGDVTSKLPRVESVLETRPGAARLIPDPHKANRAMLRVVLNDPLSNTIPWPGSNVTTINEPIELGRFEDGAPVAIRLVGEHVLIAGTMGRGKSGVLNAFMAALSRRTDVVMWGIDMKRGLELAPWQPVLDRLATTEEAAYELLSAANRVLDARADLLAERNERKWQPSPEEPALVIAVDELAELDADAMALLERLARMGRAEGIILIVVTQRPSADVLGGLNARTQMTARIALGVVEPRDGELILGAGRLGAGWRPDRLGGLGYFLVLVPGQHEQPRPARAYWLTDAAVTSVASQSGTVQRATLDAASVTAENAREEPREAASDPAGGTGVRAVDPDAALLAALRDAPRTGVSAEELAVRIGRRRTWVYKRLHAHAAAGRAVRLRPGRWAARRGAPGAKRDDT